jgi:hypothetical protein
MSENFRGKNVVICGYDENNNIQKIKVNNKGELVISNNISFSDPSNQLNNSNINKKTYYGGNLFDHKNLKKHQITKMIDVEKYQYCNIFYEDQSCSNYNYIYVMGMLDNYSYYEIDKIKLKHIHNCRKGVLFKLNIIGIKELYLENYSDDEFKDIIASVYCY